MIEEAEPTLTLEEAEERAAEAQAALAQAQDALGQVEQDIATAQAQLDAFDALEVVDTKDVVSTENTRRRMRGPLASAKANAEGVVAEARQAAEEANRALARIQLDRTRAELRECDTALLAVVEQAEMALRDGFAKRAALRTDLVRYASVARHAGPVESIYSPWSDVRDPGDRAETKIRAPRFAAFLGEIAIAVQLARDAAADRQRAAEEKAAREAQESPAPVSLESLLAEDLPTVEGTPVNGQL